MREINFDGLVGPSHNYAGLSLGNLAATGNAGATARPRAAAREGLAKMRRMIRLGLAQGFLPPQVRPDVGWLRALGFGGHDAAVMAAAHRADPALVASAMSASAMWTANAATVSPAPDTRDGRTHLTVANLATMAHRAIEPPAALAALSAIFPDPRRFALHAPVPARYGDEGAANHMRLATAHAAPGVEVFVHGRDAGGRFPARQHAAASAAVARLHGLDAGRVVFAAQSDRAIQAGAFHNDVVAVANERVLFAHEEAFEERDALYSTLRAKLPGIEIVEVPASAVSLAEAVATYLFNAQLVTLPAGGMALILPGEARGSAPVWSWLETLVAGNGPIRELVVVDVRQSMRNGGGPACLRLRVAVDEGGEAAIDPRFLLDEAKLDALEALVESWWPEAISPGDLGHPDLWRATWEASAALGRHLVR